MKKTYCICATNPAISVCRVTGSGATTCCATTSAVSVVLAMALSVAALAIRVSDPDGSDAAAGSTAGAGTGADSGSSEWETLTDSLASLEVVVTGSAVASPLLDSVGAVIFTVMADTVPRGTVPVDGVLDAPRSESWSLEVGVSVASAAAADGVAGADALAGVASVLPADVELLELDSLVELELEPELALELLDAPSEPVSATATPAPPTRAAATPSVTAPAPRDIRIHRRRVRPVVSNCSITDDRPHCANTPELSAASKRTGSEYKGIS